MTYTLLPPNDPRVLSGIAEFNIEIFKEDKKIELKEFADNFNLLAEGSIGGGGEAIEKYQDNKLVFFKYESAP